MRPFVVAVAALVACEPPPLPEEPASIEILYPPPEQTTVELDADGILSLLVVVDIDNFELVPPSGDTAPVEGQGHWHVYLNADFFPAPGYSKLVETDKYGPDETIDVVVKLAQNDHADVVPPNCEPCDDRREITVLAHAE